MICALQGSLSAQKVRSCEKLNCAFLFRTSLARCIGRFWLLLITNTSAFVALFGNKHPHANWFDCVNVVAIMCMNSKLIATDMIIKNFRCFACVLCSHQSLKFFKQDILENQWIYHSSVDEIVCSLLYCMRSCVWRRKFSASSLVHNFCLLSQKRPRSFELWRHLPFP